MGRKTVIIQGDTEMLLTTKGRYASMAMVELAINSGSSAMTLASISEKQEIDKGYLEQIFTKLKSAGLVVAVRGPGGGYKLGKSMHEISIADIMVAVEEGLKFTRCENNTDQGCLLKKDRCVTHHLWENLEIKVFKYLKSVTLAELVKPSIRAKLEVSA